MHAPSGPGVYRADATLTQTFRRLCNSLLQFRAFPPVPSSGAATELNGSVTDLPGSPGRQSKSNSKKRQGWTQHTIRGRTGEPGDEPRRFHGCNLNAYQYLPADNSLHLSAAGGALIRAVQSWCQTTNITLAELNRQILQRGGAWM